ncbi:hypothetical protein QCA50_020726 [Cerrena zonata]|uniref:Uncharacterized protein n=1 Tax=Cerrena zonata TaxID=2478898 RepID=A0AAW0FCK2_9APHY
MREVNDLEAKLGLTVLWTIEHPKYQETLRYLRKREFHRALDRVQALIVQRLFEMSKAGMSGTGYKLRRSIWKALKTRGKAIRNALKAYNALAVKMAPPAPQLEWKEVVNYGFVSEFELLRHTYAHGDVATSHWIIPAHREVLSKFFKIKGARSELVRLDVEAARLRASIVAEENRFTELFETLLTTDPLMAAEVNCMYSRRERVNVVHLARLESIRKLQLLAKGLSMSLGRGVSLAGIEELDTEATADEDIEGQLEESVQDDMSRMTEFLEEAGLDRGMAMTTRDGVPSHMLHSWHIS